ncbi:unnamed protein product [Phytomonas sp. Hart1]|nr:unnamed protein product [Phytomonas sp. Hart1]|eukprot:CCW66208.1 unnamed protein product [Phytomonas sp. isolate Hart1]
MPSSEGIQGEAGVEGGGHTPVDGYEATLTRLGALMNSNIRPLRCYGTTSEVRVDLLCLDEHVLGFGAKLSTKDRSACVSVKGESKPRNRTASTSFSEDEGEESLDLAGSRHQSTGSTHNSNSNTVHSPPQLPQAILDAIAVPPPPTHWEGAGNFSLNEAFVTVRRRTTSAAWATWFKHFRYTHRVECPDCHIPLGFYFQRQEQPETATVEATQKEEEEENAPRGGLPTCKEPSSKKEKKEPQSTARPCKPQPGSCNENENEEKISEDKKSGFPDRFIGLELKRISQQPWGLRNFQERYAKSHNLETFRSQFPEAEELQSLYGRLTALRTQSELYNNLLGKHKEQNDVQSALLQSQKSRMSTYEDKLITMQHIITTQRMQLDMQTKQVKQQDDLLSSQRNQLNTLRQQMLVESMLLSEQSKTIESQREQILVMKTHLGIQMIQERLNARRLQLEKQIHSRENGEAESSRTDDDGAQSSRPSVLEPDAKESSFIALHNHDNHMGSVKNSNNHSQTISEFQSGHPSEVPQRGEVPAQPTPEVTPLSHPNSGSGYRTTGVPSQRRFYPSRTSRVPLVGHANSGLAEAIPTPTGVPRQAYPTSSQGIACAPRLSSPSGAKGEPEKTPRSPIPASRLSNSPHTSGLVENAGGESLGRDCGFRTIHLAPRRCSRLPPVHLRGVVSTSASATSARAVRSNFSQEEQTTSRNHYTHESSRN